MPTDNFRIFLFSSLKPAIGSNRHNLFIKIRGLDRYQNVQNLKDVIQGAYRITTQKEIEGYSIIFGPMLNQEADNLFQILISKGYKQSEIIIK